MTIKEQQQAEGARRMSTVLWDLFSGSASYTNVFARTLHPAYIAGLLWNLGAGNVAPPDKGYHRHDSGEGGHVQH